MVRYLTILFKCWRGSKWLKYWYIACSLCTVCAVRLRMWWANNRFGVLSLTGVGKAWELLRIGSLLEVEVHLTIFSDCPPTTMMVVDGLVYVLSQWVFPAFMLFIISTLVLAAFGKSLGIRRIYVRVLLQIFQVFIPQSILSHDFNFLTSMPGMFQQLISTRESQSFLLGRKIQTQKVG